MGQNDRRETSVRTYEGKYYKEDGQELMQAISCGHVYHKWCVINWLKREAPEILRKLQSTTRSLLPYRHEPHIYDALEKEMPCLNCNGKYEMDQGPDGVRYIMNGGHFYLLPTLRVIIMENIVGGRSLSRNEPISTSERKDLVSHCENMVERKAVIDAKVIKQLLIGAEEGKIAEADIATALRFKEYNAKAMRERADRERERVAEVLRQSRMDRENTERAQRERGVGNYYANHFNPGNNNNGNGGNNNNNNIRIQPPARAIAGNDINMGSNANDNNNSNNNNNGNSNINPNINPDYSDEEEDDDDAVMNDDSANDSSQDLRPLEIQGTIPLPPSIYYALESDPMSVMIIDRSPSPPAVNRGSPTYAAVVRRSSPNPGYEPTPPTPSLSELTSSSIMNEINNALSEIAANNTSNGNGRSEDGRNPRAPRSQRYNNNTNTNNRSSASNVPILANGASRSNGDNTNQAGPRPRGSPPRSSQNQRSTQDQRPPHINRGSSRSTQDQRPPHSNNPRSRRYPSQQNHQYHHDDQRCYLNRGGSNYRNHNQPPSYPPRDQPSTYPPRTQSSSQPPRDEPPSYPPRDEYKSQSTNDDHKQQSPPQQQEGQLERRDRRGNRGDNKKMTLIEIYNKIVRRYKTPTVRKIRESEYIIKPSWMKGRVFEQLINIPFPADVRWEDFNYMNLPRRLREELMENLNITIESLIFKDKNMMRNIWVRWLRSPVAFEDRFHRDMDEQEWYDYVKRHRIDYMDHPMKSRNCYRMFYTSTGKRLSIKAVVDNPNQHWYRLYQQRRGKRIISYKFVRYVSKDPQEWYGYANGQDIPALEIWRDHGCPEWEHLMHIWEEHASSKERRTYEVNENNRDRPGYGPPEGDYHGQDRSNDNGYYENDNDYYGY